MSAPRTSNGSLFATNVSAGSRAFSSAKGKLDPAEAIVDLIDLFLEADDQLTQASHVLARRHIDGLQIGAGLVAHGFLGVQQRFEESGLGFGERRRGHTALEGSGPGLFVG